MIRSVGIVLILSVFLPLFTNAQERHIIFHIFYAGGWRIEPIAEYRYGRFQEAVTFTNDDAESNGELKAFALDYFQNGTKYPLIRRNERIGLVHIDTALLIGARCSLRFSGLDSLDVHHSALALSDEIGARRRSAERLTIKSDTSAILSAARTFLKSEEKGAFGKSTIEISSLNALDLNGDGLFELVAAVRASYYYPRSSGIPNKHRSVAVILDASGKTLFAGVIAADESTPSLIDCIDTDADGSSECIFSTYSFDRRRCHIAKFDGSAWRLSYTGQR